jgi:murein DD-endopeptidase MepM/ murein hydrolase activator NlpD
MAITTLSSPLSSAANKIVTVNSRSGSSLVKTQSEYRKFGDFLEAKTAELERIQLPDNKKIQKLTNINVVNTFGSAGGLLGGLLGGALDVGGLIRGFFPGEGKKVGSAPQVGKPKTKPVLKGGKLRLGGIRALGVTNALFAGLDFATGLAEGESIGKSAAGTSGALAGSLLGGVIGQSLIPIPGVGFVLGSMAGGFLGGYGADRAYDTVASQQELKAKQEAKLKEQKQAMDKGGKVDKKDDMLSKFDDVAKKFEGFVSGIVGGVAGLFGTGIDTKDMPMEWGELPEVNNTNKADGDLLDIEASGGELPSSRLITSGFGRRPAPVAGGSTNHMGVDYDIRNEKISVIQPGMVNFAGLDKGGNGSVYIDHPDGSHTRYLHLSKIYVKEGQAIGPGTVIGVSGGGKGQWGAGATTGPHLHFEYAPPKSGSINSAPYADKFFRIGGNVKVKPKAGGQATSAGTPGAVNIELHASQPGGGTGLIGSYIDKPNAVTSSLAGAYGSYDRKFRGGDLGGPKRGLNLLEAVSFDKKNTDLMMNPKTRQSFVEAQAQKLFGVLSKNKNTPINIFAGHNDVTTGETGTAGTSNSSINGRTVEQVFNDMLGKSVEQKAKAAGMTNINYIRSIIANDDKDPNTNWARSSRMRTSTATPQSQVKPIPPKPQNVSYQLPYNQRRSSTLILDRPSAVIATGGAPSRSTSVPASTGGGGGGTVIIAASTHKVETNILNKLLENTLV